MKTSRLHPRVSPGCQWQWSLSPLPPTITTWMTVMEWCQIGKLVIDLSTSSHAEQKAKLHLITSSISWKIEPETLRDVASCHAQVVEVHLLAIFFLYISTNPNSGRLWVNLCLEGRQNQQIDSDLGKCVPPSETNRSQNLFLPQSWKKIGVCAGPVSW